MRRNFLVKIVLALSVLACALGLFACANKTDGGHGGNNGNEPISNATVSGTYYYYENGEYDAAMFIKFGSTKWSDDESFNGDYKISGNNIVLYIGIEDENIVFLTGTVNNDEITLNVLSEKYVYKKNADLDILPAQKSLSYKLSEDRSCYAVTGIGGLSGDIVVPDTYKKKPVTNIADNAFAHNDSITSIVLPDTLTTIGASAFEECANLTSIEIPSSVTQLGEKAFNKCENLISVKINGDVDEIKEKTFADCDKLEEITLPSTLKSIGARAFINCVSLTDVYYSGSIKDWCAIDFGTIDKSELGWANPLSSNKDGNKEYADRNLFINDEIVTNIEITYPVSAGAFIYYSGLKNVKISSGMSVVENYTFCGCENIDTLTIANNSVSIIGIDAFQNTKKLSTLVIPDCVTEIGGDAFSGSGVESVVIGNGVINIESRAFLWCENLTLLSIGNSVVEIGEYVFSQCGLTEVTIPESVLYIGAYSFQGTPLTAATFKRTEGWITGGKENITGGQGEIPSSDMGNPAIVAKYLTTSTIYGGLMSVHIEINPFEFTLRSDEKSYSVTADRVKILCRKEVIIPSTWKGFPVTNIGWKAFKDCSSITSITIPNSVTSIGSYAFHGCSGLTSITIPNSVMSIGSEAFRGCSGLTSIEIPDGVMSITCGVFYGCSSLTSVKIPNSVTSIESYAFYGCSSLTSVILPNGVTNIESNAFEKCSSLTSIEISNGVTYLSGEMFSGCSGLINVVIPNSVTKCGWFVFSNCSSLSTISFQGSVMQWKSIEKDSWFATGEVGEFTIVCVDGTLSKTES